MRLITAIFLISCYAGILRPVPLLLKSCLSSSFMWWNIPVSFVCEWEGVGCILADAWWNVIFANTLSASEKRKMKGSHWKLSAVHLGSWWPALTILEHVETTYPQWKCSGMLIDIILLPLNSCLIFWFSFFSLSLLAVKKPKHVSSDRFVLSKVWHFLFLLQVWIIS